MRRLFFWWFLATQIALTLLFFFLTAALGPMYFTTLMRGSSAPSLSFLARYGANLYESGGKPAFAEFLEQVQPPDFVKVFLLTPQGTDVLGRQHRSPSLEPAGLSSGLLAKRTGDGLFIQFPAQSKSGTIYTTLVQVDEWGILRSVTSPLDLLLRLGLLVLVIVAVCSALAAKLSRPVLALNQATRSFASGNWAARTRPLVLSSPPEIRGLAFSFDAMADRIAQLIRSQQELIENISHEVRTPLTRLNIAVGLARPHLTPSAQQSLDRIDHEVQRLNEMVGRALRLSRLQMADRADRGEIDARDFLDTIVGDCDFEAAQQHKRVLLTYSIGGRFTGDRELLRGAVENVIRNAIRFSPPNSTVEVSHHMEQAGGHSILVRDYGPGVPEEHLHRMFEPFVRLDEAGPGFGLGLAIVQRSLALHDGFARACNRNGGGLDVSLYIP